MPFNYLSRLLMPPHTQKQEQKHAHIQAAYIYYMHIAFEHTGRRKLLIEAFAFIPCSE